MTVSDRFPAKIDCHGHLCGKRACAGQSSPRDWLRRLQDAARLSRTVVWATMCYHLVICRAYCGVKLPAGLPVYMSCAEMHADRAAPFIAWELKAAPMASSLGCAPSGWVNGLGSHVQSQGACLHVSRWCSGIQVCKLCAKLTLRGWFPNRLRDSRPLSGHSMIRTVCT